MSLIRYTDSFLLLTGLYMKREGDCLRTSADIVGYVRRSRRARKARFFASLLIGQQ